ncbi:hypothetical protein Tco_0076137, partial [Tanacetum coccineum]
MKDLSRNLKLTTYVVPTGKDNFIVSAGRPNMVPAGRTIVSPGSIIFGPGSKDLSRVGSNNDNAASSSQYQILECSSTGMEYPDPLALVANSQTLYNPSQYPQHSVSSMHPSPQQFTPVYATLIHHQLHHTPSNLVAKGFVAITLKCVRSQVQF